MIKFFKKPLGIFILIVVIIVVGVVMLLSREKAPTIELASALRGDIINEVSITGRVKAAEDVNLAFEKSGKVASVRVRVGDRVQKGAMLVSLENGDLTAQLLESEAQLAFEQAKLSELRSGTRPEEIYKAEIDLANAQKKASADLENVYDAALAAVQTAASKGKTALLDISDIQYAHFINTSPESIRLETAKSLAVVSLLGQDGAGRWTSEFLSTLDGGAFGAVESAIEDPVYENIDEALIQVSAALQKVKQALEKVPVIDDLSSTEKTTLSSAKSSINTEIASVADKQQKILTQKVANENAIAVAQAALDLKKAGTISEQITAQEAKVELAKASVQNTQAQIAKTILFSPFAGVVTKQDARVGEIVAANEAIVALLSEAAFEIEVKIPEADIARVNAGDTARVTLDAYGSDVEFEAVVQTVDLAGTLIEGVATYKTILQFVEKDERIKSGMTANVDIITARLNNVIFVPQRAVIARDGARIVRISENGEIREVNVTTGLRSSQGTIEIIQGIQEGDQVVVFFEE